MIFNEEKQTDRKHEGREQSKHDETSEKNSMHTHSQYKEKEKVCRFYEKNVTSLIEETTQEQFV